MRLRPGVKGCRIYRPKNVLTPMPEICTPGAVNTLQLSAMAARSAQNGGVQITWDGLNLMNRQNSVDHLSFSYTLPHTYHLQYVDLIWSRTQKPAFLLLY